MARVMAAGMLIVAAGAAGAGPAWGAEAAFVRKPTATAVGDTVRIDFAVSLPTDVAVSVENARGEIVRHLAAGVLGRNPPEPLKANSLEQSVVWDGKDDLGRAADARAGPFRVRVGLGLKPTFDRLIGSDPADGGWVRALATGPRGELFVFHSYGSHHPLDSSTAICVFDRQGKYLRTIMPYPASLPDERLKGLKRIQLDDGSKVPFIYQIDTRSLLPGLGMLPPQRPVVSRDGRLAFVGIHEGPGTYLRPGEARLTVINTDGSVPVDPVRAQIAPAAAKGANLALSPDERTIYLAGASTSRLGCVLAGEGLPEYGDSPPTKPVHAVLRVGWDDPEPSVFVGDRDRFGAGEKGLNQPEGVATDSQGNVYVADRGNNRIAVFKADGSFLGQVAVPSPRYVEVHKRTGEIYVLAAGKPPSLVKFDGFEAGREVARVTLDVQAGVAMALDDSADPAIVYVGAFRPRTCLAVLRFADDGKTLAEAGQIARPYSDDGPNSIGPVYELSVDRQRGLLYLNNFWRLDLARNQWQTLPRPPGWGSMWPTNTPYSTTGTVGLDGNYYMNIGAHGARLFRFGPDLNNLPFDKPDRQAVAKDEPKDPIVGFARTHGQGLTADPAGNIYVIWKKGEDKAPDDAHRAAAVYVYGPDGQMKKRLLVDASIPSLNGVRVDYAGNLYLAVGLRPGADALPPGLKRTLPETLRDEDSVYKINGYPLIYGSIVKFGPEGGEIRDGIGGVQCNYGHGHRIEVRGARWIAPGASTVLSWATPKSAPNTVNICLCEATCFDVDGFGRSFFPDAGRCRVGVRDTAGNEVCWFGGYGNQDSAGPGSAIPTPDIPLCWPQAVAADDKAVYVGDRLNRRVVRVSLTYAVQETCEMR